MTGARKAVTLAVVTAFAVGLLPHPGASASVTPWPSNAVTTVELETGSKGRHYEGTVEIAFTNTGPAPLTSVYLRLWPNGVFGCAGRTPDIRIRNVSGGSFGPYQQRCTTREVTLDAPLGPSASTSIEMELEIALPRLNDRFGYTSEVAHVGSALPVLAAEDADGVHLEPYTHNGESYYAPIGDVSFTVTSPKELRFASAGVAGSTTGLGGGLVRRSYLAEDVRDFAWAAARFERVSASAADGTLVRVSFVGGRADAERVLLRTIRSLDELGAIFGAYPSVWGELDVVRTTWFGGMEYPSLIFTHEYLETIAHEVAHQWWWGVVGNDSYRAPYLDEALAEWSAYFVANRRRAKDPAWCLPLQWGRADARLTNGMDYWDANPGLYGLVYSYGACSLAALADEIGIGRVKSMLADYAAAHWLSPMTTFDDFRNAVETAGAGVPSFDADVWFTMWRLEGP